MFTGLQTWLEQHLGRDRIWQGSFAFGHKAHGARSGCATEKVVSDAGDKEMEVEAVAAAEEMELSRKEIRDAIPTMKKTTGLVSVTNGKSMQIFPLRGTRSEAG